MGDTLLSCVGRPYDTLEGVIGLTGEKGSGSLIDFGIKYEQVDLVNEQAPDLDAIAQKAKNEKMDYIQSSR